MATHSCSAPDPDLQTEPTAQPHHVGAINGDPAHQNLKNLQIDNLDDRLSEIAQKATIGGANAVLTSEQRDIVIKLLQTNHDVIALNDNELGECTFTHLAHFIDTGDNDPVHIPCRRVPFGMRPGVDKSIRNMIDNGVIRSSKSPWSSPVMPVEKPDGSIRITVDYRKLNDITKKDRFPLTRCDELCDTLGVEKPEFFSKFDLFQGYHQQLLDPSSIEKTAFSCPSGHFEYTRLPQGPCNRPANFQRLQTELLDGVDGNKVKVYLDDICIATNTFEDHISQIQIVFDRLRTAGLRLKLPKCEFVMKEIVYLGFLIDKTGMRPNPKRIETIQNVKPPTTVKEVRQFIGLCSFYRRFVRDFAEIARPLTSLLCKDEKWTWGPAQQNAFDVLKSHLLSPAILHYPKIGEPYFLMTDASACGLGAVLCQKDAAGRYVNVALASRATHRVEQSYGTSELECLAVTWALQHFHHYIWGQKVIVEVDHQPLMCLKSKITLPAKLQRWNAIICSYDVDFVYRKGVENGPADMLSRYHKAAGSPPDTAVDESAVIGAVTHDFSADSVQQRSLQLNDPLFGNIIRVLERTDDALLKDADLKRKAQHYRVIEKVLYFVGTDTQSDPRICVPIGECDKLLKEFHHGLNSGAHFASDKMYRKMAQKFFWPKLQSDVLKVCRTCWACAKEKGGERRIRPPLVPITVDSEPFVQVGIDVITLPTTKRGNKKALGIVDYFSGYLIFVPMKDEMAETVARKLIKHLFNIFTAPKIIVSDQGTNFTSNVQRELEQIYRTQHNFTTTFSPHVNGKIERANRTLKALLTRVGTEYPEDWDDVLSHVIFAYNSTPQKSTGYAPHFLVFGRLAQSVNESIFDRKTLGYKLDLDDFISDLERKLSGAYRIVEQEIQRSQLRQKREYDKSAAKSNIAVGDSVMLHRPNLKQTKLSPSYDGPYTVVQINASNIIITNDDGKTTQTHNIDKVAKCSPHIQTHTTKMRKTKRNVSKKNGTDVVAGNNRYDLRSNQHVGFLDMSSTTEPRTPDRSAESSEEEFVPPSPNYNRQSAAPAPTSPVVHAPSVLYEVGVDGDAERCTSVEAPNDVSGASDAIESARVGDVVECSDGDTVRIIDNVECGDDGVNDSGVNGVDSDVNDSGVNGVDSDVNDSDDDDANGDGGGVVVDSGGEIISGDGSEGADILECGVEDDDESDDSNDDIDDSGYMAGGEAENAEATNDNAEVVQPPVDPHPRVASTP